MILLSYTATPPYKPVGEQLPDEEVVVTGKAGFNTVYSETKYLYLVVEDDWYDEVEIRVENETETGYSFYISTVDLQDQPQQWTKLITYKNVYAKTTRFVQKIAYRWAVIDNVHLISTTRYNRPKPHADINIYGIRYIGT